MSAIGEPGGPLSNIDNLREVEARMEAEQAQAHDGASGGATDAKTTKRARSLDMGGLSLMSQLEAKLGGAGGAGKAGGKHLPTPADIQGALEKAFPGKSVDPSSEGIWAITGKTTYKGETFETSPYMLQAQDGKLRLICNDFVDSSCSADLKPGMDLAATIKTLVDRAEHGAFDGVKPPPKGWPKLADVDAAVRKGLPGYDVDCMDGAGDYLATSKKGDKELSVQVQDGKVVVGGPEGKVTVAVKAGDDFAAKAKDAMSRFEKGQFDVAAPKKK